MAGQRRLYLAGGGKLAWTAPGEADAADAYVSDPAKPVPYQLRPIRRMQDPEGRAAWCEWLVADQRFVDGRPGVDVLTFENQRTTDRHRDRARAGDSQAFGRNDRHGRRLEWSS